MVTKRHNTVKSIFNILKFRKMPYELNEITIDIKNNLTKLHNGEAGIGKYKYFIMDIKYIDYNCCRNIKYDEPKDCIIEDTIPKNNKILENILIYLQKKLLDEY